MDNSNKYYICKYYILNMFPYPSGDGLHVGHPLGYVASDIFARYKKMKGYKVLNPMGFDSFGLPAEQYAILTGQHPSVTTDNNVKHYIEQMKNIDLDFDWERTFNTSDSEYYKWTQWIFIKMFNSFYCKLDNKAHNIEDLYKYFEKNGTKDIRDYAFFKDSKYDFTAEEWNNFTEDKKYKISLDYRIAYLDDIEVNWCEELKTVLANDEVKNGVSERGGYPVVKKKMKQWVLRITAYADRLLDDLDYYYQKNEDKNDKDNIFSENHLKVFNKNDLKPNLKIEERNIILAIIKHWNENKYLVIRYKKDNSKAFFLTGGIENNETSEEAVIREIKEETGFVNIRKIEKICNTDCTFYNSLKNINRKGFFKNYYVELENDEKIETSKEEQDILDFEWVNEDDLENIISCEEHYYPFKIYKERQNNELLGVDKVFNLGFKEGLPIVKSNIILAIIKHWSEDRYLILKYPKDNTIGFLTGKIEDGESSIEALLREIKEETGFINIKKILPICKTRCSVYMPRKDINAVANTKSYFVELRDDSQICISEEEKNKQKYFFVDEKDIYDYIKDEDYVYVFNKFKDNITKEVINWPESTKEMQRNWIGRSNGANIKFKVFKDDKFTDDYDITVFTSRPETIFGVTFIGLSKDHDFVKKYCRNIDFSNFNEGFNYEEKEETITGEKTDYFAINPINNEKIPIMVVNYVMSDYGTGAIMGVPQLDDRDNGFWKCYNFSQYHFNLPKQEIEDDADKIFDKYVKNEYPKIIKNIFKDGKFINSDFLNNLTVEEAKKKIIKYIEDKNIGKTVINYKLRDAIFSRQRYWGEPIPIYYKEVDIDNNIEELPYVMDENDLPLTLPDIDDYKPTGEAPLKRAKDWNYNGYELEVNTMPGWAGSSWYFLRYLDPKNDKEFCSKEKLKEFENVDLYLGGSEHAVGHLLYSRFYTKFLYDLGYINFEEPFKKLIHQGMILGESAIIYRINGTNKYITYLNHAEVKYHYKNDENKDVCLTEKRSINDEYLELKNKNGVTPIHIPIKFIDNEDYPENEYDEITDHIDELKKWRSDFNDAEFLFGEGYIVDQDGKEGSPYSFFKVERTVEKMSKSKHNVINPDDVIHQYGSDVLRMYLMFLGPIEQQKPWNTKGIEGIYRFLNRVNNITNKVVDQKPQSDELKIIHKCIKDVSENIENFSFNTAISSMMICLNSLSDLKNISKDTFKDFLLVLNPFAPKTVRNIWDKVFKENIIKKILNFIFKRGKNNDFKFPEYNEKYLIEDTIQYPIMIDGKTRAQIVINKNASDDEIKEIVLNNETVKKWIDNKEIKKFIIVNGKIISIVI